MARRGSWRVGAEARDRGDRAADPGAEPYAQEEIAMSATTELEALSGVARVGNKLSIIMFSGTADKFIPLGVLAQAGAAMGMEVGVFVTGFALHAFTKEHHELPFPAQFADLAPAVAEGMRAAHVEPWDAMLRRAKEMGARVHACSMMSEVMGLKAEDFGDLVDDVVGAATFLQDAEGGETFFI